MRNFLILTSGRVFARLLESMLLGLPSYFYSYTEPQLLTFPRLLVLPLQFLNRTLSTSYVTGGDLRWTAIYHRLMVRKKLPHLLPRTPPSIILTPPAVQ
jgi:hypothetical protein